MSEINYLPFPFSVTPASPMFHLSPVASSVSKGWVPSCTTPDCVPTANWTTSSPGASLLLQYWGWGLTVEGSVTGEMNIVLNRDGVKQALNSSGDTLFRIPSGPNDETYLHNVTLEVIGASPNSELSISRANINGSANLIELYYPGVYWTLPSNDPRLKYMGFVQNPSVAQAGSPTTYTSSTAGDAVSMQFNASTFLIHGPCGPTTGLMKVTIDGAESMVNTTKPIASNDCVLFQALGLKYIESLERGLLIENAGGGSLGIDRIEFFWLDLDFQKSFERANGDRYKTTAIVVVVMMTILWILVCAWVFKKKSKKKGPLQLTPISGVSSSP